MRAPLHRFASPFTVAHVFHRCAHICRSHLSCSHMCTPSTKAHFVNRIHMCTPRSHVYTSCTGAQTFYRSNITLTGSHRVVVRAYLVYTCRLETPPSQPPSILLTQPPSPDLVCSDYFELFGSSNGTFLSRWSFKKAFTYLMVK